MVQRADPRLSPHGELGRRLSRYRMPAEWATHQATWFSWPHNVDTWPEPGELAAVERAMAAAVAALAQGELVHINVLDPEHAAHVRRALGPDFNPGRVHLHEVPTNDAWCRDHGAIFVLEDVLGPEGTAGSTRLLALDFRFNAWGGKYPPFDLDDAVAAHMARILGADSAGLDMVLEGGSIDVNGEGALLTTERCLLNANRNPGLNRGEIEQALRLTFGVQQIIWLDDGIVGDDTDGHVDDISRFVAPDCVLTMVEPDRGDPNHAPLAENLERLRAVRLADGRPLRIIELPMPGPVLRGGDRLPASYANFYVGNSVVLLPVFGDPNDARAVATLEACFPGRRVVAIDSREVVVGLGAWHCLTQQVPSASGPAV